MIFTPHQQAYFAQQGAVVKCSNSIRSSDSQLPPPLRILIVDDEPNIRQMLMTCVRSDGQEAFAAGSTGECLEAIQDYVFDLCILDLRLGVESGLDLIGPLQAAQPWLRILVMTAFPGIDSAVEAVRLGATNYLSKPLTPTQFRMACRETVLARSLTDRVLALNGNAARNPPSLGFETSCPQMRAALETARLAADSGTTILIQGEPGTGKRTLASSIHGWSKRAEEPLVYASCRGPNPSYVGKDWFGSAQESRSRGREQRAGRILRAGRGTVVIEEISELDPSLHARLLRLLQRKEFVHGEEKTIQQSEARFIATSCISLRDAVIAGTFPAILHDALGAVTVHLPPLRQRRSDIPTLAQAYARYFSRNLSKPPIEFDEVSLDAMMKHSWPGNIRELKNFVERAVMLSSKSRISFREVPVPALNNCASVSIGDQVTLERVEEMHIRAVIDSSPSFDAAARTLGMDAVTLWRRRKHYGISE
jgi:NtrC-family two-component system response regulator AlgB